MSRSTESATTPPDNHVYTAVVSPHTNGVKSTTQFTHYSLLRTAEDLLGLPCLQQACSAAPMEGEFNLQ